MATPKSGRKGGVAGKLVADVSENLVETLVHLIIQQRLFIDRSTRYLNQLVCGVYKADACNRVCWTVYRQNVGCPEI